MVKQTTPPEAHRTLSEDAEAIYLDVRTVEEFAAGHPEGAINIPVAFANPSGRGMVPNPDFFQIVEKVLPKDKPILCGCKMGGRSQRAAEFLAEAGYSNVTNVDGGFGGKRDPTGRLLIPGWQDANLPVSTDNGETVSYAGLRMKAGL